MAFKEVAVDVYEGPSRWDALLGSLWEGKSVRFRLASHKISFPNQTAIASDWMPVRIMGVHRTGANRRSTSPCETVLIYNAEILMPPSGMPTGLLLNGTYNMHQRKGTFAVTKRGYEGGDFFGGRHGENGPIITGSDLITFIDP